jgi:hypothetical protein
LRDLINAGPGRVRSVLTEARNAAIDDTRIDLRNDIVIDLESMLDVRAIVFDHNIGAFGELEEDSSSLFALQIERHAALVAVQVLIVRALAIGADGITLGAARRFNLDDLRAPVGKLTSAGWPRAMERQIKHGYASERQLRHCSCSWL